MKSVLKVMVGALAAAAGPDAGGSAGGHWGRSHRPRLRPARRRVRSSDGWLHRFAQPGDAPGVRRLGWNGLRLVKRP
jgi:hypothetical protein